MVVSSMLWVAGCSAQATFAVTGSLIPDELVKLNYGTPPKGMRAFDLSICNVTDNKQPLISSQIYQALADGNPGLQPVGRAIMLAAILRSEP